MGLSDVRWGSNKGGNHRGETWGCGLMVKDRLFREQEGIAEILRPLNHNKMFSRETWRATR